jgi:hypothetical protein
MGVGGLGMGPNPQSPIPNPQSPIPNYMMLIIYLKYNNITIIIILIKIKF